MQMQQDRLFVFSGLMHAGKDFVAKYANLQIFGFADPLYELSEHFHGTRDKSQPGIRRWLQTVAQWGWGCNNDEYPHTVERGMFTRLVRQQGVEMTKNFRWVNWSEYGSRQDFWANILLIRLGLRPVGSSQTFLFSDLRPNNIAITNARFDHELRPIKSAGFKHFLVACSEDSRRERMAKLGFSPTAKDQQDISEQLAQRLDLPDERIIWNDHRPMPASRQFLTLDQFVESQDIPAVTKTVAPPVETCRQQAVLV